MCIKFRYNKIPVRLVDCTILAVVTETARSAGTRSDRGVQIERFWNLESVEIENIWQDVMRKEETIVDYNASE